MNRRHDDTELTVTAAFIIFVVGFLMGGALALLLL
jgi:hypothetical protein